MWSILLVLLSDLIPLTVAWHANRGWTLVHALGWTLAAWLSWVVWALKGVLGGEDGAILRYSSLSLTACAGVAVLGARRPGVSAWSFVLVGLLAILLRPLLEGLGTLRLQTAHLLFLVGPLLVPVLNYLPTRLGPAALFLGAGCTLELTRLGTGRATSEWGPFLLAAAPWLAWACIMLRSRPASPVDRQWRDFRDRYGVVWAQRLREQLNRVAANAGWTFVVGWSGILAAEGATLPESATLLAALAALQKRFRMDAVGDSLSDPGSSG